MQLVRALTLSGICLTTFAAAFCQQAKPFYLHPGDRVLFYGDSITDQRLYTTIVEAYVVTRYPSMPVTFINSGWGGDTVRGGGGGDIETRLQRDVFPYKPTVMTVMLGMNDGGYKAATTAADEAFFHGFAHIVEAVEQQDPGVRITAIEPSPYDDVTRPPAFPVADGTLYNQVLVGYGKWISNYGAQHHLTVADANTPIVDMLEKAQAINPELARQVLPGHIHPAFGGHMILAEAILQAWNARPIVASVAIDASGTGPRLHASEHTRVSALKSAHGISWSELDDALPLPFSGWEHMWGGGPTIALAIQCSDIATSLNNEPLVVTGLHSGVYTLSIDGKEIGTWNSDQLAAGINLALLDTPMSAQAMDVYQTITEHVAMHFDRWRDVQVPLAKDDIDANEALASMDALENRLGMKERAEAQPRLHSFLLTAVQ